MRADREFLFNYRFNGSDWGIAIHASDPSEARDKIKAVALARYEGEVFATIPVPGGGLLARLYTWLTGAARGDQQENKT